MFMRKSKISDSAIQNALNCNATLTEFIVLALYGQEISYPYMCEICSASEKKVNMLDLGPLHKKVYFHIQCIVGGLKDSKRKSQANNKVGVKQVNNNI